MFWKAEIACDLKKSYSDHAKLSKLLLRIILLFDSHLLYHYVNLFHNHILFFVITNECQFIQDILDKNGDVSIDLVLFQCDLHLGGGSS